MNAHLLRLLTALVLGLTWVDALAQTAAARPEPVYPVKPIRIVVGLAAGGVADVTARTVGQKLSEQLGQPVVVENRTGAGTSLAIERVAASAADGYTLLLMGSSSTVQSAVRRKLPFDVERDFAPISLLTNAPYIIVVHPSMPANNVKDLIALARAQPGKMNYGSNGMGSLSFLAGALFNLMANTNILEVPYKGGTENVIAVASGQVTFSFTGVPTALPLVSSGKIKALAVTSPKRVRFVPEIPTVSESGLPGYAIVPWYGLAAPANVSQHIVALLNAHVDKAMNTPEMKASLAPKGMEVQTSSPQQFAAHIRSEIEKNGKLFKAAGVKPE